MHYIAGNHALIEASVGEAASAAVSSGTPIQTNVLRINQRMRLEPTQLDSVRQRMQTASEHCVLLALPCGTSATDILNNSQRLHDNFIEYLSAKQAAGIINVAAGNEGVSFIL